MTILSDVRKVIGVDSGNTGFDSDLLIFLNSVKADLVQIGLTDYATILIDETTEWVDTLDLSLNGMVITFVALRVKTIFDPIASETIRKSYETETTRLLGRIQNSIEVLADAGAEEEESGWIHTHPADTITDLDLLVNDEIAGTSISDLADVTIVGTPAAGEIVIADGAGGWGNAVVGAHDHVEANITDLDKYTQVETDTEIDNHISAHDSQVNGVHGVSSGEIVGTQNTQTLTNKTLGETEIAGQLSMVDNIILRAILKDYGESLVVVAASGSTETLDLEDANTFKVTLDADCTLTFNNPPASGFVGSLSLLLCQNGTGSWTVTWPTSVRWIGGIEPTITEDANAIDIYTFFTIDGGTNWFGFIAGQNFS